MMEKTIRISYTQSASIPTDTNFETKKPSYTVTQEINNFTGTPAKLKKTVETEMSWVKDYIDGLIKKDFECWKGKASSRPTQALPNGHRIDTLHFPHVTSIISPTTPRIPHIDDHAELGSMLDDFFAGRIEGKENDFPTFKDKGNIKMTWAELIKAAKEWYKKYWDRFKWESHHISVFNMTHKYCGEFDAYGRYEGQKAMMDFKKTVNINKSIREKFWTQMAAYDMAHNNDAQVYVICSPFNAPIVTEEVGKYRRKFLELRDKYKTLYKI
jgi:hypothetical protein